MGRSVFWILLVACLIAAGAMYVLRVQGTARAVSKSASDMMDTVERAEIVQKRAVGSGMVEALEKRQSDVEAQIRTVEDFYASRDRDNLDRWFPELKLGWDKMPPREDFVRHHLLACEQLDREVTDVFRSAGLTPTPPVRLCEYSWQQGGDPPVLDELRQLQREFWVQDRLVRALARVGAWLARPIRGGEPQPAVGGGPFAGIRYDVQIHAHTKGLVQALHAFDGSFEVSGESGLESMALPVTVGNVTIRRMAVDGTVASLYPTEPPVEITMFITILDFREDKVKR